MEHVLLNNCGSLLLWFLKVRGHASLHKLYWSNLSGFPHTYLLPFLSWPFHPSGLLVSLIFPWHLISDWTGLMNDDSILHLLPPWTRFYGITLRRRHQLPTSSLPGVSNIFNYSKFTPDPSSKGTAFYISSFLFFFKNYKSSTLSI